jgi:putative tricarboxylic transport membrane protein
MGARGGATVVGLAVAGLGLFFLLGAQTIEGEAGQAGVGPRAFPTLIGAGLVLLGVAFVDAVRRGRMELPGAEPPAARGVLPWLLVGLAGGIVTIEPLGFPVAAAWLFVMGARGFGSRRWVRNAVLGVLLGVLVYLMFARALGVSLPGGPMDRVWPRG